jgi:CO dehydrogenase maturation factor
MKLALAGKGGVGKTSIAGTLARVLARDGYRVLALDNDLNPNLSLTLGIPAARLVDPPTLPRDVVVRLGPGEHELTMTLDEIRVACALTAPDDITLLVGGRPTQADTGCFGIMHKAMRHIVRVADDGPGHVTILDTEASTEHLCIGTAKYGLIANQLRTAGDRAAVIEFAARHELELAGCVPYDDCFFLAERAAQAPIDVAPDAAAIEAIAELAHTIVGGRGPAGSPAATAGGARSRPGEPDPDQFVVRPGAQALAVES